MTAALLFLVGLLVGWVGRELWTFSIFMLAGFLNWWEQR